MKKLLLFGICCIFILFNITGCHSTVKTSKPEPTVKVQNENSYEKTFNDYVSAWQKSDFSSMYNLLCEESRKLISETDFTDRYKKIYEGIKASNIQVHGDLTKIIKLLEDRRVNIPFDLTMNSAAGEIQFSYRVLLQEDKSGEENKWGVRWDSTMIFPDLEDQDKVTAQVIPGIRGEIRDRLGNPLAVNGIAAEVGIVPEKLAADAKQSKEKAAKLLGMQVDQIDKKLSSSYVKPYMFIPLKVISKADTPKINALMQIPGIMINDKKIRSYPLGEKAAHLTGYIQVIGSDEYNKLKDQGYSVDDFVGKTGLEKIYEDKLHPQNGFEISITDSSNSVKTTLARKEPVNGQNIQLTIDSKLQTAFYDSLKNDAGVAAAVNPLTGEVLALVSTPSYNPNSFVLGIPDSEWKSLNENKKKPFINRFLNAYCPGSSFKPITTAIGLKNKKLDPNAVKNIKGLAWQKDKSWGNYFINRVKAYKQPSNLLNALINSDNIYFAQLALDIGEDTFRSELGNFGIGEKVPFDFELTPSQFDSSGKLRNEIQLADSGYGQGEVLMNPLHMSLIYSAFVNNGNIPKPRLEYVDNPTAEFWKENVFPPETATVILKDLGEVVKNPEGTGYQAYIKDLPIAGKTGTAEIKTNKSDKNGTELGWFAAVNTNSPRLLAVVMVEDVENRGGSHYVVPIVKKVFEGYLKK